MSVAEEGRSHPRWINGLLVALLLLGCHTARAEQRRPRNRQEFAAALARVVASVKYPETNSEADSEATPEGMTEREVLALLGPPDEVQLPEALRHLDDPPLDAGERLLRYGTDGSDTMATLGAVTINAAGRATLVYGSKGSPPDPRLISERELRRLLRLLDELPRSTLPAGAVFDPAPLIRIVNELTPLGRERVLAVLDEYCRVSYAPMTAEGFYYPDWGGIARSSLHGLMPLLFELPPAARDDPDGPGWDYSVVLVDDIPLITASGGGLAGSVAFGAIHLDYYRKHGILRRRPLHPPDRPWRVVEGLEGTAAWRAANAERQAFMRRLAANQVLRLVGTVYRLEPNRSGEKVPTGPYFERRWGETLSELERLDLHWDPRGNRYTRKNGSYYRDTPSPQLRTYRWRTSVSGVAVEVSMRRWSDWEVRVRVEWKGKMEAGEPVELRLCAGAERARVAVFRPQATAQQPVFVQVAEGTRLRGELSVGSKCRVGPFFHP